MMQKDVRACRASDSMSEAVRIMWERHCGFAPVVASDGSGSVVGVITDRDLCMAAYIHGKSLLDLCVSEAMSTNVRTRAPEDSICGGRDAGGESAALARRRRSRSTARRAVAGGLGASARRLTLTG
jgi:CBS domain-containing protein